MRVTSRVERYAPGMPAALISVVVAAEGIDTGAPPVVWGVGVFVVFMIMLAMTLAFGKGRG